MGMLGYADLSADARAAGSMLGHGVRRGFGLENKEEIIQRILKGADYSTAQGRRAALAKIKEVDYEKFLDLFEKNRDYEAGQAKASKPGKEDKENIESILSSNLTTGPMLQEYAKAKYPTMGLGDPDEFKKFIKDNPKYSKQWKDEINKSAKGFSNFLALDTENRNTMLTIARDPKALIAKYNQYAQNLSGEEFARFGQNVLNLFGATPGTDTGGGMVSKTTTGQPTPTATNTSAVEKPFHMEMRNGKNIKVYDEPKVEYDVQKLLQEDEEAMLRNKFGGIF